MKCLVLDTEASNTKLLEESEIGQWELYEVDNMTADIFKVEEGKWFRAAVDEKRTADEAEAYKLLWNEVK